VQEGKQPGQSNGSELSIKVNRGAGKTSTESEAMGANSMSKGGENAEAKNPNSNSDKTTRPSSTESAEKRRGGA